MEVNMWDWNIWFKRVNKYESYSKQLEEVVKDIQDLGQTYLDVGCGDGRLIRRMKDKDVDGLDKHYNNFDLLKDEWPDKQYDVIVFNLVLVHFNKEEVEYVKNKALERAKKYIYIHDECRVGLSSNNKKCCEMIDDITNKYCHDHKNHFKDKCLNEIYSKPSEENPIWTRYLFEKTKD